MFLKSLLFFISVPVLVILTSCSLQDPVKEHFKDHGMSYPVESSGVSAWNIEYIGIEQPELSSPGVQEYVVEGVMFAKDYFKGKELDTLIPGASAVVLSKPVLFRDESGDVGLMVKVTAYGVGNNTGKTRDTFRWLAPDKKLWSVVNFAYFSQNDYYKWEYKGFVYEH
jgi:hypothetical protein